MADAKLFAGHAVRRLRRQLMLTQATMAEALGVSPSYLNLVERNQRPVSATLLLRMAETYDFDPRKLAASEPGEPLTVAPEKPDEFGRGSIAKVADERQAGPLEPRFCLLADPWEDADRTR